MSEVKEIKVKSGRADDAAVITVNFDFPSNTAEAVSKYGEETAHDLIIRALTLGAQALIRTKLGKGQVTQETAQSVLDAWVPGVRGPVTRQTPLERATSALSGMTTEQLAELMAKVKAAQKGAVAHA